MRITFKFQMIAMTLLVVASFVFSLYSGKALFYNLGWAFCGLLLVINPVCPGNFFNRDPLRAEKGVRIAGIILVFIGLTKGFGI